MYGTGGRKSGKKWKMEEREGEGEEVENVAKVKNL